ASTAPFLYPSARSNVIGIVCGSFQLVSCTRYVQVDPVRSSGASATAESGGGGFFPHAPSASTTSTTVPQADTTPQDRRGLRFIRPLTPPSIVPPCPHRVGISFLRRSAAGGVVDAGALQGDGLE